MYENITYGELKKLPKEQKAEAWKELLSLNTTRKELAIKLGVSPAIVYNMVSKYAEEKPARRKSVKSQVINEPKVSRRRAQEQIDKQIDKRIDKQIDKQIDNVKEAPIVTEVNSEIYETKYVEPILKSESFTISINKIVSGEDAQFLLNGIGSTLLKSQKYGIELRLIEENRS